MARKRKEAVAVAEPEEITNEDLGLDLDNLVANGLPPFEDASFENFGALTEEEKLALADRVEMGFITVPKELEADVAAVLAAADEVDEDEDEDDELPNHDAMVEERVIEATILEMVHKQASKRSIARYMISNGYSVKEATKFLHEAGMKIRYQQVYQATEDLRPAKEVQGTCSVCGRPLSDPNHVANGIGPICAGKQSMAGKSLKG